MGDPSIWNKEEILRQLSGDETFLKELLGDLKILIDETVPALEEALKKGDISKAGSLSHTLKGSAGNLSAQEVYLLSRDLELECKSGGAAAAGKFAPLKASCERLLGELRAQGWLS